MPEISERPIRSMEVVLEGKDAADWIYRGEGAANLVLSYTGSSPAFVGKVIRVQKAPKSRSTCMIGASILSMHECLLWNDTNDLVSSASKEIAGQLFVLHVMSPLLGSEHVDAGIRIVVSREFLESVEKNVLCQRPAWRVDAAKVNTLCDSALLMSDHSIFPHDVYTSIRIPHGTKYVTWQAKRIGSVLGTISQISDYDPLDLFSGSSERIHKAIMALFTTPQNNFRVFLNGALIFGDMGGGTDNTNFVVSEAFEDQVKGVIWTDYGLRTMSFLQLVAQTVFRSGILDRLLEAQKLDTFDIEGAIHAYYNIVSQPCMVCRDLGDGELSHRYLSLHSISLEESLKIVRNYLIAATAKDCSLMISFRPREDRDPGSPYGTMYLESTNQRFDYKAYFIDLDMKPLKKMVQHYELDQKIVSCYTQMVKSEHEPEMLLLIPGEISNLVSVELLCSKCRKKVMKLIAGIEGITSIVLDASKSTVTIIGEADPVKIIKEVRKFRKSAEVVSIGPPKDEKKDVIYPHLPNTCHRCDVWYVLREDSYNPCSIL
ncbi:hypothetical protein HHK36_031301 [Tetracentron sinense]|uniref:Inositol-pentakisphosphate 2-kinase n=1 Tax=Tetracentron sinense TaxID=13715 RepID=A0A834YAN0_TETSI|nr:hypothetical protein HHK36_031301 [Tetracentron sinense]